MRRRAQTAPEQVTRAGALIALAEGLAGVHAEFRRCHQGIDDLLTLRTQLQGAIVMLRQ